MILATVDQVLSRMNSASTNADGVITSELEAATSLLESSLGTTLSSHTRVDFFTFKRRRFYEFSPFQLHLSSRFLQGKVDVYNGEENATIADITGLEPLEQGYYLQDSECGVVMVNREVNQGYCNLAVRYDAGFLGPDDESIPQWLRDAAITIAVQIHQLFPMASSKRINLTMLNAAQASFVSGLINNHIKLAYSGLIPEYSNTL